MYISISLLFLTTLILIIPFSESIISLGGVLMLLSVGSTVMVTWTLSSWFSFILFLMYITGMLVLFSYLLAMTPNNTYTKSSSAKQVCLVVITTLTISTLSNLKTEMKPMKSKNMEEEITQLYNNMSMSMYWVMATTLLVALLMAVKLCYKSPKPLRQFLK